MKKIDIRQFSHLEKLATLTHLYLELRLPLAGALRAAKADLQMDSPPDATQQVLKKPASLGSSDYTNELAHQVLAGTARSRAE